MDRRTRLAFLVVVAGAACIVLAKVTGFFLPIVAGMVLAVAALGIAAWPRR